mmetsp:Transcript_11302/g.26828  ORF Transcript_11302/g.26828 Transcript_11302/m.26828 type:complete len:140 (+) Transcript_11302:464-883(+)
MLGLALVAFYENRTVGFAVSRCLLSLCLPMLLLSAPSTDTRTVVVLSVTTVANFFIYAFLSFQVASSIFQSVATTPVCAQHFQLLVRPHCYLACRFACLLLSVLLVLRLAQRVAPPSACAALSGGLLMPITTRQLLAEL